MPDEAVKLAIITCRKEVLDLGINMINFIKKLCVSFVLILMIVVSGCKPIKETDLYGTYVAKYPFGVTEKLVLSSNGEYSQEVNIVVEGRSKTLTNTGRWKYDPMTKYLTLDKALVVDDGFEHLRKDYDVPFPGSVMQNVSQFFPWSPIKISATSLEVSYIKLRKEK